MQTLAEGFKKQLEQYQNNPSKKVPPTPHTSENQTQTMDEKINELSDKYSEKEVLMVKKIFNIMDARYLKKHEHIVKNIKESVLNDLKK
jgi:molecular chaperone GrpE (heat shock protein)